MTTFILACDHRNSLRDWLGVVGRRGRPRSISPPAGSRASVSRPSPRLASQLGPVTARCCCSTRSTASMRSLRAKREGSAGRHPRGAERPG